MQDGKRIWVEKPGMANDNSRHFPVVGEQFMQSRKVSSGMIGTAEALLFPTRDLVDFAEAYFTRVLM